LYDVHGMLHARECCCEGRHILGVQHLLHHLPSGMRVCLGS
jgi:hypothetical protein